MKGRLDGCLLGMCISGFHQGENRPHHQDRTQQVSTIGCSFLHRSGPS